MSYCVQCGVELASGEERCPLCATPVLNPNIAEDAPPKKRPYSKRAEAVAVRLNRQFATALISAFMVAVVAICAAANVVADGAITWSQYVTVAVFFAWVCAVTPLLYVRRVVLKCLASDAAALLLMLYVISQNDKSAPWFVSVAVPIVGSVIAFAAFTIYGITAKFLRGLHVAAVVALLAGAFCILLELFIDLYIYRAVSFGWSVVCMVAAAAAAFIFFLLERKRLLKEALAKRFHL